jgi:hypothetical protein
MDYLGSGEGKSEAEDLRKFIHQRGIESVNTRLDWRFEVRKFEEAV